MFNLFSTNCRTDINVELKIDKYVAHGWLLYKNYSKAFRAIVSKVTIDSFILNFKLRTILDYCFISKYMKFQLAIVLKNNNTHGYDVYYVYKVDGCLTVGNYFVTLVTYCFLWVDI